MPRSWPHTIASAAPVVLALIVSSLGLGLLAAPVPAAAAAAPLRSGQPYELAEARQGGGFDTVGRWSWIHRDLGSATSEDHFVEVTVSGIGTRNRNAGLVVRRSSRGTYAQVSLSGGRYQVRLYDMGRPTLVVDEPFYGRGTAVARTEVRGTVVRTTWGGRLVSEDTIPRLGDYTGRGVGLTIWQERSFAVSLRSPISGSLSRLVGWRSGASGTGAADGQHAAWRGRPLDIAGTWNDDYAAQTGQWSLLAGAEYGAWQGDIDVAVGGIYKDRGETWSAAAAGAYDARWRRSMTNLVGAWGNRPGTLYIRFAHEFNGSWSPWSVQAGEAAAFVRAWKRFRAIQEEIAPRHQLVFCPNVETSGIGGFDWRTAFPGAAYVDVLAVDAYNQYPFVETSSAFTTTIDRLDGFGAPAGLERHRQYAEATGLPFAVSEWSSNSTLGDSPVYVSQMHDWFARHAGTGPGDLRYEIQFNATHGDGRFQFFPGLRQPRASQTYAQLW